MNKYSILIAALILLVGAYTISVFVAPKTRNAAQAATATASNAPGLGAAPTPANRNQTVGSRDEKPMGKNAERVETAPNPDGFATLSKEERLRQITSIVDLTYKKVIAGLRLSTADQEKLRALLVERSLARWDAHDIATVGVAPEQDSLNRARELTDRLSDEEVARAFSPEVLERVHAMIAARPYIARINQHYDPAMAQAGVPLMPEQVLPLAEIFHHTFGSVNNPQLEANRRQVDPVTGLTPLDLIALDRAKAVLTQAQLDIVRQKIAALNRAYYLGKS